MLEFVDNFAVCCAAIALALSLFFTIVFGWDIVRGMVLGVRVRMRFTLVVFVYIAFEVAVYLTCIANIVRFFLGVMR